ncbi:hypothetical protein [Paraglaciecola sp. T6c]|uniref:hypothetical protein n=1 Tax=Pseudoalteromonas atlantica (strain T6c / ATCC BAA-1087) TaxID=3042615 RepID=UPI0005A0CA17|nr:hypothetical protein [Paraglaciecola sp. T6c]
MNTKTTHTLTLYQQAVLGEMGIVAWYPQGSEPKTSQLSSQDSIRSDIDPAKTNDSKKTSPVPDAIKRLKTQSGATSATASTLDKKIVPNSFVLGVGLAELPEKFLNDILSSIGISKENYEQIADAQCTQYDGYPFAWQVGDDVMLEGRLLTTPAYGNGFSSSTKKQLWATLSGFKHNND